MKSLCPGSSTRPVNKVYRDPKYTGPNSQEGYRTACPECGKVCAVGPTSNLIQKHGSNAKAVAEAKEKQTRCDNIYQTMYRAGKEKITSAKPNMLTNPYSRKELEYWIAGFRDGLGDAGLDVALDAFNNWLALDEDCQEVLRS